MNLKKNHLDFQYAGAGDGVGNEEGAGQQVRVIVTGIDGERHDLGELPVNTTISNVKQMLDPRLAAAGGLFLYAAKDTRPEAEGDEAKEHESRQLDDRETLRQVMAYGLGENRILDLSMVKSDPLIAREEWHVPEHPNVIVIAEVGLGGDILQLGDFPVNTTILDVKQELVERWNNHYRYEGFQDKPPIRLPQLVVYNAKDTREVEETELDNDETLNRVMDLGLDENGILVLSFLQVNEDADEDDD